MPPAPPLSVARRLADALMPLASALGDIALAGSTPTLTNSDAETLFQRLCRLITTLFRIGDRGIRAPRQLKATPADAPPEPAERHPNPDPAPRLPRRLGWLLAALPDAAPATAAGLRALLADPALADFLAAAPTIHRTLRPVFRALGLAAPPPPARATAPRKRLPAFVRLISLFAPRPTTRQRYLQTTTLSPPVPLGPPWLIPNPA